MGVIGQSNNGNTRRTNFTFSENISLSFTFLYMEMHLTTFEKVGQ